MMRSGGLCVKVVSSGDDGVGLALCLSRVSVKVLTTTEKGKLAPGAVEPTHRVKLR